MRFIQDLSSETLPLLQKIYKKSKYHRVRQRAHCLLLSSQGYTIKELSHIFNVDRITIYNWFHSWESRRLAGLYDRPGKGRKPIVNQEQREQIRQWIKRYPKNVNQGIALIQKEFAIKASKSTIKRILKFCRMTWRRIRRKVRGQPDPATYEARKEALAILMKKTSKASLIFAIMMNQGFVWFLIFRMHGKSKVKR
jgi:transposase